jgi:uncharacterized protein YcaQ
MEGILERVRSEGALRANSIEGEKLRHGTWWNWRPEKMALEHLFSFGELMIAGRLKFQRVYDLTERVLPAWVETSEPSSEERDLFWLERGAKALGISLPRNAADYTWMKRGRDFGGGAGRNAGGGENADRPPRKPASLGTGGSG